MKAHSESPKLGGDAQRTFTLLQAFQDREDKVPKDTA